MTDIFKNKLTIYLIKNEYKNHEEILRNFGMIKKEEIKYENEKVGMLYYDHSHVKEPLWIRKFFRENFKNVRQVTVGEDSKKLKLFNSFSRSILIINCQGRLFAISFGFGRTLLETGILEERFGLKIVLNTIEKNSIKHINKKNMSSVPKNTSEQLSRAGVPSDFGIDIEQDMIQSITGKSKDKDFGKSITGQEALSVNVVIDLSNIKEFLKKCYKKYKSSEYKKDFGWIDQIEEIKNITQIEKLNNKLIENINKNELEKTWMAVPEIIEWVDVLGFAYKESLRNITLKDDICLPDFIDSLSEGNMSNLLVDILKKKKIFCFSQQSEQVRHRWSAYNCLYCEIKDDINEKVYILSNGKWYEVENNFAEQIKTDYINIRDKELSYSLPSYNHENEGDYNKKVAENNNQLCCMDCKNISYGGGYSSIEFCDLLTNDKRMIHVKRYGGSSVLSHLFSQGIISGELFISDNRFREKVNKKLPESHKISDVENRPIASNYEIIFAIISSHVDKLEIPFFSKVNLRNAKRRLEAFGYRVSLLKINDERLINV